MGMIIKTLIRMRTRASIYVLRALSLVSMLCFTLLFVVRRDPLVSNNQIWQQRTSQIYVWTGNLKINLNKQQEAFNNSFFKINRKSRLWQLFEPEVSCLREVRVGPYGDGSKWVCDPVVLRRKKCMVYSFGSAGLDEYERELWALTNCEIHIFDPSDRAAHMTEKVQEYGAYFHKVGLGDGFDVAKGLWGYTRKQGHESRPTMRLHDIVKMLGHDGKIIDILKVDIEGNEYVAFKHIFDTCDIQIVQLQIELHWYESSENRKIIDVRSEEKNSRIGKQIIEFFRAARNCGYYIFHKEPHPSNFPYCIEYALINTKLSYNIF